MKRPTFARVKAAPTMIPSEADSHEILQWLITKGYFEENTDNDDLRALVPDLFYLDDKEPMMTYDGLRMLREHFTKAKILIMKRKQQEENDREKEEREGESRIERI